MQVRILPRMLSTVLFILITLAAFTLAFRNFKKIYRNILLGKKEAPVKDIGTRLKNVLLIAFGQKKMFALWKPAVLHAFIYLAFLLTQLELIEILSDGVFHRHRVFAPLLGNFYTFLISIIEILSLLAFVATFIFLWRRNILKLPRFHKAEMTTWPRLDANLILLGELILVVAIFTMNGADQVLQQHRPEQYPNTGNFAITGWFGPMMFGHLQVPTLAILERTGWWLHYLVVLGFINYLPLSKHLHIFLAFPQTYYAQIKPRGSMENMPVVMNEVKSMLGLSTSATDNSNVEISEFGAKDVFDLPRRVLLGAYSCTECGRCTAVCPANLTGKKLSPRKIMMDIRDRMEEIGRNLDTKKTGPNLYDDGKSLFSYILPEEIHACTTCQACVEACPVLIDPMEPILELRRNEILSQSTGPANWTAMFNSLENNGCVWPMSEPRSGWTQ
jgi:heterodisulfide reductase subunit C